MTDIRKYPPDEDTKAIIPHAVSTSLMHQLK
jgi:hypothetical protein